VKLFLSLIGTFHNALQFLLQFLALLFLLFERLLQCLGHFAELLLRCKLAGHCLGCVETA
jgi:hypothetical protein